MADCRQDGKHDCDKGDQVEDRRGRVRVFPALAQRHPVDGQHRPVVRLLIHRERERPEDHLRHEHRAERDARERELPQSRAHEHCQQESGNQRAHHDEAQPRPPGVELLDMQVILP